MRVARAGLTRGGAGAGTNGACSGGPVVSYPRSRTLQTGREGMMSKRAEALARRIEEGGEALAAYAQGLTDAQWRAVVPPDGRQAGVIIHHVATVYPIEVDLARQIASGKNIAGLTWAVIAKMNAKHAQEQAAAGKQETIDLLRANSRAAAEAVRRFSDDELDRAAPVSLNGDAPLTAQFMIEDHALRHSWHHLAKIKAAISQ